MYTIETAVGRQHLLPTHIKVQFNSGLYLKADFAY